MTPPRVKYFIVTGEASGDMHAANLAEEIFKLQPTAEIEGWGGEKMTASGVKVYKHYNDLAIIGFTEVISKLSTIRRNFKLCQNQIAQQGSDTVILVDFSGFNLRLAKKLRKNGFTGKIVYYISPKLWVWNSKRVEKIKKYIDAVLCILPFEVDFYADHGYKNAHYIGNPLMDEIESFKPDSNFIKQNGLGEKPIIALLPGSRENELKNMLPFMKDIAQTFTNYEFVVAGVPWHKELIAQLNQNKLKVVFDKTYDLLSVARAAIVTSGTATLETALFNVPQVVIYKGNYLSYALGKRLVNVKYISLVNLILNRSSLKEFIQPVMTMENVVPELRKLLEDEARRTAIFTDYAELKAKVEEGGASRKAAEIIIGI